MADHPTRADIDLLEGSFYVDDPRHKYAWMRANAPVYYDAPHNVWGFASYAAVAGRVEGPEDVLERGRHPSRQRADPDDDRHGRPGRTGSAASSSTAASRPAGCATASRRSATSPTRSSTRCANAASATSSSDIAAPLPMILIGDMLGVAPEDRDDLLRWSDDMVSVAERQRDRSAVRSGHERDDRVHRFCDARGRAAAGRTRPTT